MSHRMISAEQREDFFRASILVGALLAAAIVVNLLAVSHAAGFLF